MTPLFEVSAPVRADVATVREMIDSGWVLRAMLSPSALRYVDVEHAPGTVAVQGHWWYRGEVCAEESGDGGSRLVQRVHDVARRGAWAVPLANRLFIGYRAQLQRGTDELARKIEVHLRST